MGHYQAATKKDDAFGWLLRLYYQESSRHEHLVGIKLARARYLLAQKRLLAKRQMMLQEEIASMLEEGLVT